jgi:molybdopterin synthase catalytic subunit
MPASCRCGGFVSAGHTEQATGACAKIVGLVKEKLPIWKKELFGDEPVQLTVNDDYQMFTSFP